MKGRYCPGCGYDLSQLVSIANGVSGVQVKEVEQSGYNQAVEDEKIKQIVENVKLGRGRPRKSEGMKKLPIPKPQTEEQPTGIEQEPRQVTIPTGVSGISQPTQLTFKRLF